MPNSDHEEPDDTSAEVEVLVAHLLCTLPRSQHAELRNMERKARSQNEGEARGGRFELKTLATLRPDLLARAVLEVRWPELGGKGVDVHIAGTFAAEFQSKSFEVYRPATITPDMTDAEMEEAFNGAVVFPPAVIKERAGAIAKSANGKCRDKGFEALSEPVWLVFGTHEWLDEEITSRGDCFERLSEEFVRLFTVFPMVRVALAEPGRERLKRVVALCRNDAEVQNARDLESVFDTPVTVVPPRTATR